MNKTAAIILSLFLVVCAYGQQPRRITCTISGSVTSARSGESLTAATITSVNNVTSSRMESSVTSNEYGFYSLSLMPGDYTITCSYVGYKPIIMLVDLSADRKIDFALEEESNEIDAVVVQGVRGHSNIGETQVGIERLEIKELSKMPMLFGERDILKSLQLLPGVRATGEGSSGMTVRGGSADQNMILLDEATVYNASHLMGFFSTFNSDAIKDVSMYKGTAPANFGGRISSVIDVRMNEGNNRSYAVSGGIGLIASRINVEGPIVRDKGSFIVSARRTYADIFLKMAKDSLLHDTKLYFYDINAKANYSLGTKDKVFVSGYFGRDVLGYQDKYNMDWGNATLTARWNHIFGPKLFSNTSFIYSNFSYEVGVNNEHTDINIVSKIRDINLKQEFQYYPGEKHKLRIGYNTIFHTLRPEEINSIKLTALPNLGKRLSWENAVFVSDEWRASNKLSFIAGVRVSSFTLLGPGKFFTFDRAGNAVDSANYKRGEFIKTYVNPEPRLSANYIINSRSSVKAGYARNTQYMHLLSNSTVSSPTDMWMSTSNNILPELSDIVSLGYFRNFLGNQLETGIETYYKYMRNQIDFRDGAQINANEQAEGELLYGRGRAYGVELFLKKRQGRLNGWISYTLARTERKIDGINDGRWYPARQDCTHDISVVGNYTLSPKWEVSFNWVYNTGNAVTFPSAKYQIDQKTYFYYTERNGYRMPAYHRLDIGATWTVKKTARWESSWNFSIYNVYGRQNAFAIDFRESETDSNRTEAVQTALFRWIPSFTYNFKFK